MSYEEELHRLEEHLATIEQLRQALESKHDQAPDLIEEIAEEAKGVITAIERARRAAETEAVALRVNPNATAD